jgi:YHS domain-containing protein
MKVLIALGLAVALCSGCSSPPNRWETRGDRVLGIGSDEDPVTGAIVSKKDAVKREYQGTLYYFESSESAGIFARNPAEYAVPDDAQDAPMDRFNAR